jgi:hypothetical protein
MKPNNACHFKSLACTGIECAVASYDDMHIKLQYIKVFCNIYDDACYFSMHGFTCSAQMVITALQPGQRKGVEDKTFV